MSKVVIPSGYEVNGHVLPALQPRPTYNYKKHSRLGKQSAMMERHAAITTFVSEAIGAPHSLSTSTRDEMEEPLQSTNPSEEEIREAMHTLRQQGRAHPPFYRRSHSPVSPFTSREAEQVSLRRQRHARNQLLRTAAETAVRFEMEHQKRYQQRRERFSKALAVGQPFEVEKLKSLLSTRWRVAAEAQEAADHELTSACREWEVTQTDLNRLVSSARNQARLHTSSLRPASAHLAPSRPRVPMQSSPRRPHSSHRM
jgi:hypothetical protein